MVIAAFRSRKAAIFSEAAAFSISGFVLVRKTGRLRSKQKARAEMSAFRGRNAIKCGERLVYLRSA